MPRLVGLGFDESDVLVFRLLKRALGSDVLQELAEGHREGTLMPVPFRTRDVLGPPQKRPGQRANVGRFLGHLSLFMGSG